MPEPSQTPSFGEGLVLFRRLALLIRPHWKDLASALALGGVAALIGLIAPLLTRAFVDTMYPSKDASLLNVLVAAMVGITLASSVVGSVRGFFSQVVTGRITNALSMLFYNHVQHLPVRFFDQHRVGEVLSRVGDVRGSIGAISKINETIVLGGLYCLVVPPLLFWMNWKLAALSLLTTPITGALSIGAASYLKQYWKRGAEAQSDLGAMQVDFLSQIRTLKLASAESAIFQKTNAQAGEALRLQLYAGGVGMAVSIGVTLVRAIGTAACTWYGWTLILQNEITLGDYLAFSAYLGYLIGPVSDFTALIADFQRTAVSLSRMFEYLDVEPELDPSAAYQARRAPIRRILRGEIELRNVSFGYSADRMVLSDLSVRFARGSSTAIVGSSGAGKSTIVRLLCGFDQPASGAVLFDGMRVSRTDIHDIRRQMAVVWQETGLIGGTILDNLTIGVRDADAALVENALRICQLEDTVASLAQGLHTEVAEWGSSLSGGQRQRVALARAIIRRTPILLLDEATANLDLQTEANLLRELLKFGREQTIIFVTHRPLAAAVADHVCLLAKGTVVALGTHARLIESNEEYRNLQQIGFASRTGQRKQPSTGWDLDQTGSQ